MKSRSSLALVAWLAASLAASPNGLAAGPQQTPPPLPPDTVNQMGLQWKLHTIGWGDEGATKPFRYSLCEGRYLKPGEVSRPCNPSPESTASSGHQATYVFSAGHNKFLPKGLRIDGFGILHGDDPALLKKVKNNKLPLCVRQLDVERCKDVQLAKETLLQDDPIAKQIDNGSGPPKKGMSVGKMLVGITAGTAAALGAAYYANQYAALNGDTGGSGGMTYVDSQGIVCLYNAGGVLSSCAGNVLVNITSKITVGSTIRLFGRFWKGERTTSTSPPGSINFFLQGGTGGTSCPGPLTSLALSNLSESSSTVIAEVGGISIPVTCR